MFILGQKWIRTGGARYESAVYYGKFGGRKIAVMRMKNPGGSGAPPGEKLSDRRAGAVYDADAERTRVSASAGGILNIDILSFQRLAYRIFEETGGSLYPVLEETGKKPRGEARCAGKRKKELTILGSTFKKEPVRFRR